MAELPTTEVSEEFIQGMRNRMLMSFYKYGPVKGGYPHRVKAIDSLYARLDKYKETGNTEWLIDASNFAMIEFMCPSHSEAHFKATGSEESPGRVTKRGPTRRSNSELKEEANDRFREFVAKVGPAPMGMLCASEPWPPKAKKKGGEGMTKADMKVVSAQIVAATATAMEGGTKSAWKKTLRDQIESALDRAAREGVAKRGRKAIASAPAVAA